MASNCKTCGQFHKQGYLCKGIVVWNKGTKGVMRANNGSFIKGQIAWNKDLHGVYTAWNKGLKGFRKGYKQSDEHKNKIGLANKGQKRPSEEKHYRIFDINNGITLCRPCHQLTMWKEPEFAKKYFAKIMVQV